MVCLQICIWQQAEASLVSQHSTLTAAAASSIVAWVTIRTRLQPSTRGENLGLRTLNKMGDGRALARLVVAVWLALPRCLRRYSGWAQAGNPCYWACFLEQALRLLTHLFTYC